MPRVEMWSLRVSMNTWTPLAMASAANATTNDMLRTPVHKRSGTNAR